MDDEVPLLAAAGLALLMWGAGAAVSVVARRAADGRLRVNHLAGIRTRSTMRSDAAWRAGHAAAVPLSDLSGGAFAVSGLVSLAVRSPAAYSSVLLGGVGVATVLLMLGARRAVKAADAAE
jgi:hypothetical protein